MKPIELVVAPSFQTQLATLESQLPHAIILAGQEGVGLGRVAAHLGGTQAVIISPSEATKTTHGSIGIDRIRELYVETRGLSADRQVIIIDDADRMSEPAQNAFLKLLEEPGKSVHFILTSHYPERLLSTIRSRAQTVYVPLATAAQSRQLLERFRLDDESTRQLLFVASGRPAELIRLANNPRAREELVQTIRDARSVLGGSRYQAYHTALGYGDTLAHAEALLHGIRRLLEHALAQSSDQQHVARLEQLIDTHDRLRRGANPKLQLARFVVQYH